MHEDFHCQDLSERASLVINTGQFLINTDFYGASVRLYHFKKRLVEVYYHPVNLKVMRVSSATSEDLNKHLRAINIDIT